MCQPKAVYLGMGRKRNPIYNDAYQLYLDGLSLSQVALEIGVTRQAVFKAFKKRGFHLRGPNFRPFQIYNGLKFTLRNNGYYSLSIGDRMLMHRYVWENERSKIPVDFDIHHLDEDKANNKIDNLECLSKSEHTKKYSPHNNQYTKGKNRASH